MASIYLDNLATTPPAPEVLDAMRPWLEQHYGNPASSTHEFGWNAAEAVEAARNEVARLIGARAGPEVVFTSGATESNNTIIKGIADAHAPAPVHVVTTAIEHSSVLAPSEVIARRGAAVTLVDPGGDGVVDVDAVVGALSPETRLVSVMFANNEVGTIQPISEIAAAVHEHGILLHVDAAQAVGKTDVDVEEFGIDVMSISAHKLHGPMGVGAMYIRDDALPQGLPPLLHGCGQEVGRRAGTPPVAQIVGFGAAAAVARAHWREHATRVGNLTSHLWNHLRAELSGVQLNGSLEDRLPGCLNISVAGVDSDTLIAATPGLALSTGSACGSRQGGSHVLRAMGLSRARERSAIRVGIGRYNTPAEVMTAGTMLVDAVRRIRAS
jgi:cysteine desulfurase